MYTIGSSSLSFELLSRGMPPTLCSNSTAMHVSGDMLDSSNSGEEKSLSMVVPSGSRGRNDFTCNPDEQRTLNMASPPMSPRANLLHRSERGVYSASFSNMLLSKLETKYNLSNSHKLFPQIVHIIFTNTTICPHLQPRELSTRCLTQFTS
mmetsp:Transcript_46651/g.70415  ORF Transcript_46651/g.70415 Transcript_46651/m.70415 type:complete len:151 (-) Transcript_46651:8-460(-)